MKPSIRYRKGFKYQLYEDYTVQTGIVTGHAIKTAYFEMDALGKLLIYKGYTWDGPSGPTIDTPDFMRGSLVHDVLYHAIRLGLLQMRHRNAADRLLQRICIEDGMCEASAWCVYKAVSNFGESSALPNAEPKILTAP